MTRFFTPEAQPTPTDSTKWPRFPTPATPAARSDNAARAGRHAEIQSPVERHIKHASNMRKRPRTRGRNQRKQPRPQTPTWKQEPYATHSGKTAKKGRKDYRESKSVPLPLLLYSRHRISSSMEESHRPGQSATLTLMFKGWGVGLRMKDTKKRYKISLLNSSNHIQRKWFQCKTHQVCSARPGSREFQYDARVDGITSDLRFVWVQHHMLRNLSRSMAEIGGFRGSRMNIDVFRNYARFRNFASETMPADSETPHQKPGLIRFRHYT